MSLQELAKWVERIEAKIADIRNELKGTLKPDITELPEFKALAAKVKVLEDARQVQIKLNEGYSKTSKELEEYSVKEVKKIAMGDNDKPSWKWWK